MHVQALGGTHVDRGEGSEPLAHQMAVNPARREDHGDRRAALRDMLVAEDQVGRTPAHGFLGLPANPLDRCREPAPPWSGIEGAVDPHCLVAQMLGQGRELTVGEDRRIELQQRGLLGLAGEDVAHVSEPGEQAHDAVLTQGVDRRVGHLREHLAEVIVQSPILAREHGDRRVVAHRAGRLLRVLHHGMEHQFELLHGIADHPLAQTELVAREHAGRRRADDEGAHVENVRDPGRVGPSIGEHVLDLAVVIEPAFG